MLAYKNPQVGIALLETFYLRFAQPEGPNVIGWLVMADPKGSGGWRPQRAVLETPRAGTQRTGQRLKTPEGSTYSERAVMWPQSDIVLLPLGWMTLRKAASLGSTRTCGLSETSNIAKNWLNISIFHEFIIKIKGYKFLSIDTCLNIKLVCVGAPSKSSGKSNFCYALNRIYCLHSRISLPIWSGVAASQQAASEKSLHRQMKSP